MSGHDWKVLAAFGLMLGGLTVYDAGFATKIAVVAFAVVLVKNADKIPNVAKTKTATGAASPSPSGSTTLFV